jgi:hypothetical protein
MGAFYFSFENDTKEHPYIPSAASDHANPTYTVAQTIPEGKAQPVFQIFPGGAAFNYPFYPAT